MTTPIPTAIADSGTGPGPWRRWLARMIDVWTTGLALSLLLPANLTVHNVGDDEPLLSWLGSYFSFWVIYIVIEAVLLVLFGATLGKAVLGMRVETLTGRRPRPVQALLRTIRCWLQGMGTGFPLFAWVTMPLSYRRLRQDGITPWDRATELVVRRTELSAAGRKPPQK